MTDGLKAKHGAYWAATSGESASYQCFSGALRVKAAIVGGGYSGLSAALHLAKSGVEAALLEAKSIGWGASGRNAAGLSGIWPAAAPSQIEAEYGPERGARMNEMIARSANTVAALIEEYRIRADLRLNGLFIAAHRDAAAPALEAIAAEWSERGNPMSMLAGGDLKDALRTERYSSALKIHNGGTLNPLSYARGLARAARKEGALIFERSAVRQVRKDGALWKLTTNDGEIVADWVICATNAYTGSLSATVASSFYRLPLAVIASAPIDNVDDYFPRGGAPLADSNNTNLFWFFVNGEKRMIASVLPPATGALSPAKLGAHFERKLRRVYPDAPAMAWTNAWTGDIALRPDRSPKIFRLGSRFLAPCGYSGQGIATATALGREIAAAILTNDDNASAMPFDAPDKAPLARLAPVAIQKALYPALKWSDRFY